MHKILARQIKRALGLEGEERLAEYLSALGAAEIGQLLQRVDATYEQHDQDLELRTRSLDLASEELLQANRKLRLQLAASEHAEKGLRLAASVFGSAQEGISITDGDNNIVDVNDAFVRITGFERDALLGQDPGLLSSGAQGREFYAAMWQAITGAGHWQGEVWNRRPDGEAYAARLTISVVRDGRGEVTHYIGVLSDITAEKRQKEELERVAHFDALTGVPNRVLLADRMRQALAQTRRNRDLLAVCYLDVDDFKPINDGYGHEAGDRLLVELAERLGQCLRGGDTVARLGGDEFVLLLLGLAGQDECDLAIRRIREAMARPFNLGGHLVAISASIGVTLFPEDESDPDTLLRHADHAMYQAKQAGGNRHHQFDSEGSRQARRQRETVERVAEAIARQEFLLHYQPKVNMRENRVEGVEALIRWQHPTRGLLAPAEFLPAIGETDLIVDLGDWVLGEALRQAQAWHDAGLDLGVSVNIAARHLQQGDFVRRLEAHLAGHPRLPGGRLSVEVLETAALDDIEHVSRIIDACHELGVGVELDDFGTGYSSLTYLRRLPADSLKIDRSFVRDMLDDREDLAIVEGVIGLATAFKMNVIAEGVETLEHGVQLMVLGCDVAQGYGIAQPMPGEAVAAWVAGRRPYPIWQLWASRRLDPVHLPLMLAQYDHVRWVQRVIDAAGQPALAPPDGELADRHRCRFGQWYDHAGKAAYGHLGEYRRIDAIHTRVHEVGREIVRRRQAGDAAGATALCQELLALRNQMVARLAELQEAAARAGAPPGALPRTLSLGGGASDACISGQDRA